MYRPSSNLSIPLESDKTICSVKLNEDDIEEIIEILNLAKVNGWGSIFIKVILSCGEANIKRLHLIFIIIFFIYIYLYIYI